MSECAAIGCTRMVAKLKFQEEMMSLTEEHITSLKQQIQGLNDEKNTLSKRLECALVRIQALEEDCSNHPGGECLNIAAGTGSSETANLITSQEDGSQGYFPVAASDALSACREAEAPVCCDAVEDPLQGSIKQLSARLQREVTLEDINFQIKTGGAWGCMRGLVQATLALPGTGQSYSGEGACEEEAKRDALRKALWALDEDTSVKVSRTVLVRRDVVPRVIGQNGIMKTTLERAFLCSLTIKDNSEATITGLKPHVKCLEALLGVAAVFLEDRTNTIRFPGALNPHVLEMMLPGGTQGVVFNAMSRIGEQQGALILSPTRSQERAGDFTLWIVSVTEQARLAAKLEVIAEAVHKLQKLDKMPNALVRFEPDLREQRSSSPDAAMDIEWLEVDAQERSFAKYLVGEHGQLASRVAKTTGCQSFRCFEDSEADARPGHVRVIACFVGDKLARKYGHLCVTWLLDQWKSGHYADITQSALDNDPNITYAFVPLEQAKGDLKRRLLELQNETATLCFYQSTKCKVERMKKECEILVIFSRDAASRDKAVTWLSEKFGFEIASRGNGH